MSKYFTLPTFNNRKLTSSVRAEKKLNKKRANKLVITPTMGKNNETSNKEKISISFSITNKLK
jgi:hypothetical protein